MRNCKVEFQETVANNILVCAEVSQGERYYDNSNVYLLPIGFNHVQYKEFLDKLDFEYDAGYGFQHIYGTIWFENGTWAEREEYDGSEWWSIYRYPEIPKELL